MFDLAICPSASPIRLKVRRHCAGCGKVLFGRGLAKCFDCREVEAAERLAGRRPCVECGEPAFGKKLRCEPCWIDNYQERRHGYHQRRRAEGRIAPAGRKSAASSDAKPRVPGECVGCGTAVEGMRHRCKRCWWRHFQERKQRRTREWKARNKRRVALQDKKYWQSAHGRAVRRAYKKKWYTTPKGIRAKKRAAARYRKRHRDRINMKQRQAYALAKQQGAAR